MRMRLSAAYKGMNVLLMKEGAQDFRSGQKFDHTVFFGENVDIHHIFPQDWCKKQGIKPKVYDSIINKGARAEYRHLRQGRPAGPGGWASHRPHRRPDGRRQRSLTRTFSSPADAVARPPRGTGRRSPRAPCPLTPKTSS